eukprot:TRINITY_DN1051_c1_g2_i1.p1 TRINITY_DN1051_c1_g2~~TRINITY_DN1051_c1_g2_i1.p1  ORF type:complete len:997 (+),score=191.79 TRINITY_DN1051_c1_g2_i1:258-3248(+)
MFAPNKMLEERPVLPPAQEPIILQCLMNMATSTERTKMQEAESVLLSNMAAPGYTPMLVKFLLAEGVPFAVRQLAGLVLKRAVKEQWMEGTISNEDKANVKTHLPQAFFISERKISTVAAVVVGEIAGHDFPEEWPTLIEDLAMVLNTNKEVSVIAATVKALKIIAEDLSPEMLPYYCNAVLSNLAGIIKNGGSQPEIRRHAIQAVDLCVQLTQHLTKKEMAKSQEVEVLLKNLPDILSDCVDIMSVIGNPALSTSATSLITISVQLLPSKVYNGVAEKLVNNLVGSLQNVSTNRNDIDDGYSSEGDIFGYESLGVGQLSVLKCLVGKPAYRSHIKSSPNGFRDIYQLLISMCKMTDDEIEEFMNDPGKYAETEIQLEDGWSCTTRETAAMVLEKLHQCMKKESLGGLLMLCQSIFQQPEADQLLTEATLLALQTTYLKPKLLVECGFTARHVFDIVEKILSVPGVHPLLASRCFWLVSETIKQLDSVQVPGAFLSMLTQVITSESTHKIVFVHALKCYVSTVVYFESTEESVTGVSRDALNQSIASVVASIGNEIRKAAEQNCDVGLGMSKTSEKELLSLSIENLALIIHKNKTVPVASLPLDMIKLWQRYHTDYMMIDSIEDMFAQMCANESASASLRECISYLANFLNVQGPQMASRFPGLLSSAVRLLYHIAHNGSKELLQLVVVSCLGSFKVLAEAHQASSSISLCLRTITKRVGGSALANMNINGTPALKICLDVMQTVLGDNDVAEFELQHSGKLVLDLIATAGDQIGMNVMGGLLTMVVGRLNTSKTSIIVQELLIPICGMSVKCPSDMIQFIKPQASTIFTPWLTQLPYFIGCKHELLLLLAGLLIVVQGEYAPFEVEVGSLSWEKGSRKGVVDSRLAMYIGVAKMFLHVLEYDEEEGDLLSDLIDSEEDEEFEEDEEDASEHSESEDSEVEQYSVSKDLVLGLVGTEESVMNTARAFLKSHMADLAPKSASFLQAKQIASLQKELS